MPLSSIVFIVSFLIVAVIAWIAISGESRVSRKVLALAALAALVPTGYLTVSELLGRPKPASTEFLQDLGQYHRVIAYEINEDEAIYLWLRIVGSDQPRVFSFDYDTQTISRLQKAEDRARSLASSLLARVERDGTNVKNRLEFVSETEFKRALPRKPVDDTSSVTAIDVQETTDTK